MYATCLFCHARLGANAVLERFPVGRRIAFDEAKGRLWVVCRACGRWNLTPLEERWEAIEECDRRFRDTRLRVSTANIGLARLREGLELVRIGDPLLPELAAWRYGREFLRRRRANLPPLAAAGGGAALAVVAGAAGLLTPVVAGGLYTLGVAGMIRLLDLRARTRVATGHGEVLRVRTRHVRRASLQPDDLHGWSLRFEHSTGMHVLTGEDGRRAAGAMLVRINRMGATAAEIEHALAQLERVDSPDAYFTRLARGLGEGRSRGLDALDRDAALALEMAAHDAVERRAAEGELAALAREWQVAEEIAGIADDLLLPAEIRERLAEARARYRA